MTTLSCLLSESLRKTYENSFFSLEHNLNYNLRKKLFLIKLSEYLYLNLSKV